MKRIFIIACGVALGISLTLFFNYLTAQPQKNKFVSRTNPCLQCSDDFYGLTVQEFMEGVARYNSTHAKLINNTDIMDIYRRGDARACWYSIDTLKKFICLIEKYSDSLKIQPKDLGIRFFYAAYSDRIPKLYYRNHHTLFMVPTYRVDSMNIDFDPRFAKNHQSIFAKGRFSIFSEPKTIQPLMLTGLSEDPVSNNIDMSKNQGQLCPPNCPEETWKIINQ